MKLKLPWRYWRPLLAGVLLLALATMAFWPRAVLVERGRATKGDVEWTVDEDGQTRVKDRYVISSPLSGQLPRMDWKAGQAVEAGRSLLAVILPTDPALLDVRRQAEAELRVKSAEANALQAAARLQAAQEAHLLARDQQARLAKLVGTGAVSREDADVADHQERITAEAMRAAQFAVQVAQFEIELERAALLRIQPGTASDGTQARFEIRSPISGSILRVLQESASVVTPGQPLLEVGNTGALEVVVDVLSSDATRIRPGAAVSLEQWGGGPPLPARVRHVEPAGFTKLSALGVEEQRVNVVIDFENPAPEGLGDAYRVLCRIRLDRAVQIIKVPSSSLFRKGIGWAVFTIESGRARIQTVEVGLNNGLEAEIRQGLSEGAEVILYPTDQIQEGTRVR